MAKKFIIDQKSFKYGDVEYHLELKETDSNVKGGGYWHIDDKGENLYLYGASADFGPLTLEELKDAKNNLLVSDGLEKLTWVFSEDFCLYNAFKSNIKF